MVVWWSWKNFIAISLSVSAVGFLCLHMWRDEKWKSFFSRWRLEVRIGLIIKCTGNQNRVVGGLRGRQDGVPHTRNWDNIDTSKDVRGCYLSGFLIKQHQPRGMLRARAWRSRDRKLCEFHVIYSPSVLEHPRDTRKDGRPAIWQVGAINIMALGKIKVAISNIHKQSIWGVIWVKIHFIKF